MCGCRLFTHPQGEKKIIKKDRQEIEICGAVTEAHRKHCVGKKCTHEGVAMDKICHSFRHNQTKTMRGSSFPAVVCGFKKGLEVTKRDQQTETIEEYGGEKRKITSREDIFFSWTTRSLLFKEQNGRKLFFLFFFLC